MGYGVNKVAVLIKNDCVWNASDFQCFHELSFRVDYGNEFPRLLVCELFGGWNCSWIIDRNSDNLYIVPFTPFAVKILKGLQVLSGMDLPADPKNENGDFAVVRKAMRIDKSIVELLKLNVGIILLRKCAVHGEQQKQDKSKSGKLHGTECKTNGVWLLKCKPTTVQIQVGFQFIRGFLKKKRPDPDNYRDRAFCCKMELS